MSEPEVGQAGEHPSLFQLLVLALSVFCLVALAAETFFTVPPETQVLLLRLDTAICVVFLGDFAYRFAKAESKARFMVWGWVDLVSSLPALPALRWGRVIRVYRLLRVLRAFRSVKFLLGHLYRRRARAVFASTFFSAGLVTLFSSVAVLTFESRASGNIQTAGDGLWWSLYTLANMDYMGRYPVSFEGKLIRFLLVATGMVLFAVVTGYAASLFIEPAEDEEIRELRALRREVAALREKETGPRS